jgi:hypothetical protein
MLNQIDSVLDKISSEVPKGFPNTISQSIFDGLQLTGKKLKK